MKQSKIKVFVYTVKIMHLLIVLLNVIAIPVLLCVQPWYVSIPLVTLLTGIASNDAYTCVLTKIENQLRAACGMPLIKTFIDDLVSKKKGRK